MSLYFGSNYRAGQPQIPGGARSVRKMSVDPRRTQPFPDRRCRRDCQCSRFPDLRNRWGDLVNPRDAKNALLIGTSYPCAITDADGVQQAVMAQVYGLGCRIVVVSGTILPGGGNANYAHWNRTMDNAVAAGLRVVAGFSQHSPWWGWDGTDFDVSLDSAQFADWLAACGGHAALLALVGLSEPWDAHAPYQALTPAQVLAFYTHYHLHTAIPIWTGFDYISAIAQPGITAPIADYYLLTSAPCKNAAPDWAEVNSKIGNSVVYIRTFHPTAPVLVYAQSYEKLPNHDMPTQTEFRQHAELLLETLDADGIMFYPWLHGSYTYTLASTPQADGLRAECPVIGHDWFGQQ